MISWRIILASLVSLVSVIEWSSAFECSILPKLSLVRTTIHQLSLPKDDYKMPQMNAFSPLHMMASSTAQKPTVIDCLPAYIDGKPFVKPIILIVLKGEDLDEKFVRCTGNGGQKVNKSSSKVDLVHNPTGIKISCQDFRDLSSNRDRARKLLRDKLDFHFNGKFSKIGIHQEAVRKRKKSSARKSRKKYGVLSTREETTPPLVNVHD